MFLTEPSASIILGFSTQILSSLILISSILWGIIVGVIPLFSSMMFRSSLSMKLLNDSMSESTKLCSSKYFLIRVFPYLYIRHRPVKCRFAGCLAFPHDFYYVADFHVHVLDGCVCLQYFRQLLRSYVILFQ